VSQTPTGVFRVLSGDGSLEVAKDNALDFETLTTHSVTVRATDSEGLSVDAVVTIEVRDVNEPPSMSDQSATVNENVAGAQVLTL